MNASVTQIIEGTFVVIVLAWILIHAKDFSDVVGSIGKQYVAGVGVLMPKQ